VIAFYQELDFAENEELSLGNRLQHDTPSR